MRPPRPCNKPGCSNLVRGKPYCPECERKREHARGSASQRGYGAMHRAWRDAILARDPSCRTCDAPPSPSDVADHVVPIRLGGSRFDLRNGARMCWTCHQRKRQREGQV